MNRKTICMPITLARKIELVAKRRNLSFNEAVIFLLKKVEAPFSTESRHVHL